MISRMKKRRDTGRDTESNNLTALVIWIQDLNIFFFDFENRRSRFLFSPTSVKFSGEFLRAAMVCRIPDAGDKECHSGHPTSSPMQ